MGRAATAIGRPVLTPPGPMPMLIRRAVFWLHLLTGLCAGAVILAMAVTGALLAFEPQIVERAEAHLWLVPPPTPAAPRLPLSLLVARARELRRGERATAVELRPSPNSSVRVSFGRDGAVFMHPYTGAALGSGATASDILHVIEDWHRWLGSRDLGRPVTGAANLAFLGLALSGFYLWWPRGWSRRGVKAITVPDVRLRGRARDFNWHNSVGFWCAPVLVALTLTGGVMSYQWAGDLLYRLSGNAPPARAPRAEPRPHGGDLGLDLDALAVRATGQSPGWVAIILRLPERPGAPVTAFIQEPPTWHPSPRSVLVLGSRTAAVLRWEPLSGANLGRRLRALVRVLHTGEVGGWPGQLVAGLASLGGAVLVFTGACLALRRARARNARRRTRTDAPLDRAEAAGRGTSVQAWWRSRGGPCTRAA